MWGNTLKIPKKYIENTTWEKYLELPGIMKNTYFGIF